jgi:nitrous oxidase accessory protein
VGPYEAIVSIKQAVELTKPNDTIIVRKSIFRESNIKIDKPVTLIGETGAIIDCNNANSNGFLVVSNNVTIENLTIKNIGISYVSDNAAIKFQKTFNCKVSNITVENGFFGIYFAQSKYFSITNCQLVATRRTESNSGNGIHLWYCSDALIAKNRVFNHRDGIYFEFVTNALIRNNECTNNLRYGLHFMFSDSCSYVDNLFAENGAGVAVMYTKNVLMKNNRFENNWGPSSYGLLLKDIRDSYVANNSFNRNTVGVFMEGSSRILFEHNDFNQNGWALRITANCENNTFRKNNFINNTFEVFTNSMQSFNYFSVNYWSGYSGYDLNKDGIGDVPYIPVTLFSIIAESNSSTLLLLRSFFVDILEAAEKVFPSIVPKLLVDKSPSMRIFR